LTGLHFFSKASFDFVHGLENGFELFQLQLCIIEGCNIATGFGGVW
jgi:hypothetical protein